MIKTPKKTKYTKYRKGVIKGFETKNSITGLSFGEYGIKLTKNGRISARQLEAARKVIVKHTDRQGQLWLRICPDYPVSAKPNESRMGKGKGPIHEWVFRAKAGTVLFEVEGADQETMLKIVRLINSKIPLGLVLTALKK